LAAAAQRGWLFALVLLILVVGVGAPAWGQLAPVGPPPLPPLPPSAAPKPEGEPQPPGEAERPGAEEPPRPPEQPSRITAPPPPAFEFIQQELARPDPTLAVNPLAVPRHFFLRGSLGVLADDNVFFAPPGQKQGAVSLFASLAGEYRLETERTYLQTANSITASYNPSFSSLSGVSFANLNFTAGHQVTPRFTLGISDSFAAGNSLLQSNFSTNTGAISAQQTGESKFLTNTVSPQATYLMTERTTLTARYVNTIVLDQGSTQSTGNSTTNTFGGTLSHSLTQRTTATVGYSLIINNQAQANSETDNDITAGVNYALTPRMNLSLNGSVVFRNIQNTPSGNNIYSASLGASRIFSPTFSAAGSVGLQIFQGAGQNNVKPTFNFSLTKSGPYYQITGSGSLGTTQNIGQVNNVGLTRDLIFLLKYTYSPSQVWFFNLQASYQRTDFSQAQQAFLLGIQQSTITKTFAVVSALNYNLARSVFLTLSYITILQDSTQAGQDLWDNRAILSITAQIAR
jgi:hypothetical protein